MNEFSRNPKLTCNQLPSIDLSVWRASGGNPLAFQQDFPGPQPVQQPVVAPQQQFIQQTLPGQQTFVFPQIQTLPSQQQFVQMPQQIVNQQGMPQLLQPINLQVPIFNQFRFRADADTTTSTSALANAGATIFSFGDSSLGGKISKRSPLVDKRK